MNLFRVDRFGVHDEVRDSFDDLPQTDHKDGTYRLRRFSRVKLLPPSDIFDGEKRLPPVFTRLDGFKYDILEDSSYNQSSQYNNFQGDVAREFEHIDPEVLNSVNMRQIITRFCNHAGLMLYHVDNQVIDIHQMRIITDSRDQSAQVSPEGVHQDGFYNICMASIRRYNVGGGELTLSTSKTSEPFFKKALNGGEMITLRDDLFWHNGTPIYTIDETVRGYQDLFVLTAVPVGGKND